jgi:PilZ domain
MNSDTRGEKEWGDSRVARRISTVRELSVIYEGRSEEIALRPPDISARGMFINTRHHFPEGAVLNVQFRLGQTGAEVTTRAEVRYCLPGVGVGVEFVNISEQALEAIEKEVNLQHEQELRGGGDR